MLFFDRTSQLFIYIPSRQGNFIWLSLQHCFSYHWGAYTPPYVDSIAKIICSNLVEYVFCLTNKRREDHRQGHRRTPQKIPSDSAAIEFYLPAHMSDKGTNEAS